MDDVGRYCILGIAALLLVLAATFFSSAEVAVSCMTEGRLKRLSDDGDPKAKALLKIKERQFDFSLWIQTASIICIILACCLSLFAFTPLIFNLILKIAAAASGTGSINNPDGLCRVLSIILTLAVSIFISITVGKAIPRKMVLNKPEEFAFSAVYPLKALSFIFKPLNFIIFASTRGFLRLCKIDPDIQNADITEEEIRMLVDTGNENGTIEFSEREMINNIFEFDDREIGDVMTHRTELAAVSKTDSLKTVLSLAIDEGFSRIPVYDEDIDDIVGILYAKDLLKLLGAKAMPNKAAGDFMRPVIYVPESTRCHMLFREFKAKKIHMAVVVDEYGGTAGIVTMEDLLESIVGSIQDEYDEEAEEINRIDEDNYILQGGIDVEEIEELFGFELSEDEDSETLGGLIANTLGRIPEAGETPKVEIGGVIFTVSRVEDRRIIEVTAQKLHPEVPQVQEEIKEKPTKEKAQKEAK